MGDAVTALTVYVVLLMAIPTSLRLPALGGVGYLAAVWAVLLGVWWVWLRAHGDLPVTRRIDPARAALFALVCAVLTSYLLAMRRALPFAEISQADIGVLRIGIAASIVLVAADGITSWARLLVLLRRLALAGGLFACLGIVQFLTDRSWIDWVALPGFVETQSYSNLIARSGFTRSAGTAMHPLEYAAGMAVIFPIALTLALSDESRTTLRRWFPATALALALVLSGSRSGYLGLLVGACALALSWSRAVRIRMVTAGLVLATGVFVAVPGMLGTIRGMFLHMGVDPSAQSRSGGYALVSEFVSRDFFFGRGAGTFLPFYRILDNQVLLLLVEIGVVGLLAFVALVLVSASRAWQGSLSQQPGLIRQIGPALTAAVLAGASLTSLFDSFAFPIAFGTLFLAIGLAAAYARLSGSGESGRASAPRLSSGRVVLRPGRADSQTKEQPPASVDRPRSSVTVFGRTRSVAWSPLSGQGSS